MAATTNEFTDTVNPHYKCTWCGQTVDSRIMCVIEENMVCPGCLWKHYKSKDRGVAFEPALVCEECNEVRALCVHLDKRVASLEAKSREYDKMNDALNVALKEQQKQAKQLAALYIAAANLLRQNKNEYRVALRKELESIDAR